MQHYCFVGSLLSNLHTVTHIVHHPSLQILCDYISATTHTPNADFSLDTRLAQTSLFPALLPPHSFYTLPLMSSLLCTQFCGGERKWIGNECRACLSQISPRDCPSRTTNASGSKNKNRRGLIRLTFPLPDGSSALPPTVLSSACVHGRLSFLK